MKGLLNFFNQEKQHFDRLTNPAQKLLSSIFLYNLIGPISGIFLNAFLWRQSHDITLVALYNLALFAAIPLGFYLNGLLMKKFTSNSLYSVGLLLGGLVVSLLMFLSGPTWEVIVLFGFIDGIAAGIYWANRNLLTLRVTQSENRIYFSGLESSFQTVTDIIIPLLIGYFITAGNQIHLYSPIQGYQILTIIMLLIIGVISLIMTKFAIKQPVARLFLRNAGKSWNRFRLYELFLGFLNGASAFLPVLIVLALVGQEGALGTMQSFAAILSAVVIYMLGKRLSIKHRMPILIISVLVMIFGGLFLGITYSAIGVFVYFACKAFSDSLTWITMSSLNYDIIDKENQNSDNHYAYVCDQEIYLNAGRILGVIFFLMLIQFMSNEFALRFAPLFFALSQLFLVAIAISAERHHRKM